MIYLSTDAAESETNLLQSLVVFNDRQVPLVKRPEHDSSEKWDALLHRNHIGGDVQVHIWSFVVFLMLSVTDLLNNNTLL